ncbi:MAG: response regulator [Candidatus Latescibacteria bacterium]|nr:response regulator [Candidatus Latescibacterota bacterium]
MVSIKIIDDDVELAENLSLILEKQGYAVSTLDRTEGAVEDLVRNKPDLLILDIMFPENLSAGFDLARRIRQTREIKDLPVILLTEVNQHFPTDFSSADIDPDWMPVQDFVEKPVDIESLLEKVRHLFPASEK